VKDCERFGAQGITVHPRPDERHIRYQDVRDLKKTIQTEFNIEGNPKEKKFIDLVLEVKPEQVTLVPDQNNQLTSDHGWDIVKEQEFLIETIQIFKAEGIRTSLFLNAEAEMVRAAKDTGTDRIELYTESYCKNYLNSKEDAVAPFKIAAQVAQELNLGVNAGHDLNLQNLSYLRENIPNLLEVSIGHALVCDALYFGLENTIQLYLRQLKD
jgi:pyridoxine 5-phosphate synthase